MEVARTGLWSWLMQRVTGAILVVGMAVHIFILPLSGKTITFETVSARLRHAGWLIFDLVLLAACLYHGFNGLWSVLLDFKPSPGFRRLSAQVLTGLGVLLLIYGAFALVPFTR
jgi:succinate dehydrogenase hydrophobic membrane anchor protein